MYAMTKCPKYPETVYDVCFHHPTCNKLGWCWDQIIPGKLLVSTGQHQPYPENKVYGASMGPTWGLQDPGGPHGGPMNLAIWVVLAVYKVDIVAGKLIYF